LLVPVKRGDLLLYYKSLNPVWIAIKVGEILEDGIQDREYFHCAVALDDKAELEADGIEVAVHPIIHDGSYDVFRPPLTEAQIEKGLSLINSYRGQKYDWWKIGDDALRFASGNAIHLPSGIVANEELHKKICNTPLAAYLWAAGFIKGANEQEATAFLRSPEDGYLLLKGYQVAA